MGRWLWWIRTVMIGLLSLFFLIFGIDGLIAAYRLRNAHEFIMLFFSVSLIILISLTGLIYVGFQVFGFFHPPSPAMDEDHDAV